MNDHTPEAEGEEPIPAAQHNLPETPESAAHRADEQAAESRPEETVESLAKQLEEEKSKAERYLTNWQRAQADFVNFKRRTEQERGEVSRFANSMLVLKLLPAIDDLERALGTIPPDLEGLPWFEGLRLIHRKLLGVLESEGVTPIQTVGQEFTPHLHEAVAYEEGEEGKVVGELQRGYKMHDRVLRPALVKVGRASAPPANDP